MLRHTILAVAFFTSSTLVCAEPYVGIQYKRLTGERSNLDYTTSQINAIFGYEFATRGDFSHAVEYLGPISSSTGQIGKYNVETTMFSLGYKILYKGLYAKFAYAKLDRDDRDLEATSDRARSIVLGYEHAFNPTTSVHLAYDTLRNSNLKMTGVSIGSIFRF